MTIRERVARAIDPEAWGLMDERRFEYSRCTETLSIADAAINAFLAAAAEQGWHMRPDVATEDMDIAGLDDPKAGYCDQCMQTGHSRNSGFPSVVYDAMLAAAPEFNWRDK